MVNNDCDFYKNYEIYTTILILRDFCEVNFWLVFSDWSSPSFSPFKSISRIRLLATPSTAVCQASQSITNLQSWLKLMSIELVMPSNHLILCCPLLLLPSIFPSIRVFALGGQSKEISASASVLPINLQDWFPLGLTGWISLQAKGLSRVQHHSSKASILRCSTFLTVQLSHPYMTTGKTIALTRWTFVGKVTSLLFNMLSRLLIALLLRSNFMAAVTICSDFGASENKASHCFYCFSIYLPWSDRTVCHDLSFLNVDFLSQLFHSHQKLLQFFFPFCHKGGVICISEVFDISHSNLDSSLSFIQPGILHNVLCI